MADERDLELLDDYLTNRMGEADRLAFEKKLQADPDLQHEYALQKRLIKGIRDARIAELKSVLNSVPVSTSAPGSAGATKIILGTFITLLIAAGVYWYISQDKPTAPEQKPTAKERVAEKQPEASQPETHQQPEEKPGKVTEQKAVEPDRNQTSAGTEHSKPSLAKKPDPLQAPEEKNRDKSPTEEPVLDVFDPGAESRTQPTEAEKENQPAHRPGKSSLVVETDRENTRFTFHYQFRDGKLFLFGPFEQNLYEIMEFFAGEKRTVFLYYKDRYYRLEEADARVRPLEAITDPALLKKLSEYRTTK